MGLYTSVTLSDKHNRKVSPSGLKGPQGQDQAQGETSEGICLRVWPMDWTGAQGSIPAEEKRECAFLHMPHHRGQGREVLTKGTVALLVQKETEWLLVFTCVKDAGDLR